MKSAAGKQWQLLNLMIDKGWRGDHQTLLLRIITDMPPGTSEESREKRAAELLRLIQDCVSGEEALQATAHPQRSELSLSPHPPKEASTPMLYLESFTLPVDLEEDLLRRKAAQNGGPLGYIDNPYPCRLFASKDLQEIWFRRITIFYGGNGSGKSTLLNLIARKLELNRIAPHNSGEMFDDYAAHCRYTTGEDDDGFPLRIPNGSRIITSDDVFDYMLALRTNNADIAENKQAARADWTELKYGRTVKLQGMEDYEALRAQVLARRKSVSRRDFIRRTAGEEVIPASNGETALRYFEDKLKMDTLYCLDEPENSLSPKLQLQLVELLDEMARCCGCQFIIATHSPFLLALPGARIYDLDACPAEPREWWQLENTRIYFDFFIKHRHLFENQPD